MVGAHGPELGLAAVDLGGELVDEPEARSERRRPRFGNLSEARSARPATPKRSLTGTGWPKAMSVAWIRFLSAVR
jgi:hypothetical protein